MIHVIAIITTKPGQRETVLEHFRANMPAVHAEKGCVKYVPVVDEPDGSPSQASLGADTFMVVEEWDSLDDLQSHAASGHMAAYSAKVKDLLAGRTIHVLRPATG